MSVVRPWGWDEWCDPGVAADLTSLDRPLAPADAVAAGLVMARRLHQVARHLATEPWRYFSVLATLGAADLTLARAAEPHLDAVATLRQAGLSPAAVGAPEDSTWGVFAAAAPGARLTATPDGAEWRLHGTKAGAPWPVR